MNLINKTLAFFVFRVRMIIYIGVSVLACAHMQVNAQIKNPFLSLNFDSVILYDYQPYGEDPSLFDSKGEIGKGVEVNKRLKLDLGTAKQLNLKLGAKESYGQANASCFEPHLAIGYFKNGKIIQHIMVCIGCNVLSSSIDIPAQHQNKQRIGNDYYYTGHGMSKSFRQFLNRLLVKYNFSHQIEKESMFDK